LTTTTRTIAALAAEEHEGSYSADEDSVRTRHAIRWAALALLAIVEHVAAKDDDAETVNLCRRLAGLP